ncbi:MAG: hypothetical protein DHS20C14_17600 [Phycisphaeraceae bacterium]|nr:MAG: hypothetical protein DHS20C14_17600 [Phycisphaeraceae bacterium]
MSEEAATSGGTVKAPLGRRWLVKMTVFIVLLLGLGVWGLYDATSAYPARGEKFASWAKYSYLTAAQGAERGGAFGAFMAREVTIEDPAAELARLQEPEIKQRNMADVNSGEGVRALRANVAIARERWLGGLDRIGKLNADRTRITDPRADLVALGEEWATSNAPKPLAAYDIPLQWAFTVVGFVGGGILLVHVIRVASRKYAWDAENLRLTVPGGHIIGPDDLDEVDKSRWDKFIVILRVSPGHTKLGGRGVRIDTYQHAAVEPWVLAMEEKAFPDQQEAGSQAGSQAEPVAGSDAGGPAASG